MPLVDRVHTEGAADTDLNRYVILGNGPAGTSALLAIREVDPKGEIVIVSPEVERYYSKILLTYWIAGKSKFRDIFLVDEGFYERNRVKCMFGVSATRVDTISREVELSNGERLTYDSLLLAMGSSPQAPDIPGTELPGVYYLRTLADAKKISQAASDSRRGVVIGGGLVSIKTIEALLARGVEVLLVVSSKRLLSQITAPEDSKITLNMFRTPGLHIRLNCDVEEIEGYERVEGVRLSTGEVFDCDMVVVGKGVTPNVSCIRDTEIQQGTGILVSDMMETSVRSIYAAGDIAEGYDIARGRPWVNALWSSAVWQGRIAGYNMAGRRIAYLGDVALNSVSFGEKCLITLGKTRPENGDEVVTFSDECRQEYRRLVFSDGRLVGAVISGPSAEASGVLRSLMARKENTDTIRDTLLGAKVSYGNIVQAGTRLPHSDGLL